MIRETLEINGEKSHYLTVALGKITFWEETGHILTWHITPKLFQII